MSDQKPEPRVDNMGVPWCDDSCQRVMAKELRDIWTALHTDPDTGVLIPDKTDAITSVRNMMRLLSDEIRRRVTAEAALAASSDRLHKMSRDHAEERNALVAENADMKYAVKSWLAEEADWKATEASLYMRARRAEMRYRCAEALLGQVGGNFRVKCLLCGEGYDSRDPAWLEHDLDCPEHPMRDVERELSTERAARQLAEERARVAETRLRTLNRLCFCKKKSPYQNIEHAADAWAVEYPEEGR